MTKLKFIKKQDKFVGLECRGHTGYAEFGKDTLCATISGITQSCLVGLIKVLNINPIISRDDHSGYLKIELPKGLDINTINNANLLFAVVYESIKDLLSGYSKYISMEVIENDY